VTRRLFVALPIPDDLRTEIGRTRRTIERELPEAAWVRPPNQHLTLKFLGDTDDDRERELVEALGTVASAPIPIRLAGGGFFPPGRSPRVAWLGGTPRARQSWRHEWMWSSPNAGSGASDASGRCT
jgi:2'-5' RNA ligase